MTVHCSVQPYYRYSGLSTDPKPMTGIQDASTFWETDSGREYEWRGDNWYLRPQISAEVTISDVEISNFPEEQTVKTIEESFRLDDYSTEDVVYKGWAAPGSPEASAVWKVQKIDMLLGIVKVWADGNVNYDNRWDQRLILDYS